MQLANEVIDIEKSEGVRITKDRRFEILGDALWEVEVDSYALGMLDGEWDGTCGAFEIELAAAEKGYGPFMYDVAAGIFGWIMSSRTQVSLDERGVWVWMYNHPEAYTKRELTCKVSDSTIPRKDRAPLNYSYSPRANKKARTKSLVNNHNRFFKRLHSMGFEMGDLRDLLDEHIQELFAAKYPVD